MKDKLKKQYDMTVYGTIKDIKARGQDFPTMITVNYVVNSVSYEIIESIKLKSEPIKLGFLTIGQKKVPTLPDTKVGASVTIKYNSANPKDAIILDNTGIVNC